MKNINKWFSIIYVFFLISLVLSFWVIILNKQSYFEKNLKYSKIQDVLSKNIFTNADILLSKHLENNFWSWFYKPFLSCPENIAYYSWETLLSVWSTKFYDNYCSGTLNSQNLQLFFTWNYQSFWSWIFDGTEFNLNWTDIFTWELSIPYLISFSNSNTFDDRFIKSRTEKEWIILKNTWWQNIYWINDEFRWLINKNTNNTWSFLNIWKVSSWALFFDVNGAFSWKIIEFDKTLFNTNKKLLKTNEISFSSSGWVVWYLQDNLSFSWAFWSPKYFDFKNKDYWIFLSYSTGVYNNMRYKIKVFSNTQTWVYINPIKDDTDIIEYLWNNIIIDNWSFYYKIHKISKNK